MKRSQFWLVVLISVVFIWLALRGLHFDDFWTAIKQANYAWIIPGILIYFVGVLVRSWRWQYLLNPFKKIPMRVMFPTTIIVYMGNNIYPSEKEKSSGVTCELVIHGIDWLSWIMESPVVQVSAELTEHALYPGIDDNMWMILKFENGALGIVGASYTFLFSRGILGSLGKKWPLPLNEARLLLKPIVTIHWPGSS